MSAFDQIRRITAGASIVVGPLVIATAADSPHLLEGARPERQSTRATTIVPVATVESEPAPARPAAIVLTRESRRFLDQSTRDSSQLMDESTSTFQRGLMPLTDYLNQLSLVEYVDVRAADLTASRGGRAAVYQRQVERMEDAYQRLRAFNQPASEGWQGDTILAELALTEAQAKLAEARGDNYSAANLRAHSADLAEEHFQQRQFDYTLGIASLPMMAYAARLSADKAMVGAGGQQASALDRQKSQYLDLVLAQTQVWSDAKSGIGREDRVITARLGLDRAGLDSALAAQPPALTHESVSRASQDFAELFDQQREFHRHGTASLYDMAATWVAWHDVQHRAAETAPETLDDAEVAQRGVALQELQSLASNVQDLRGRNAPDVAFVQLAGRLDGLDELYTENRPEAGYLP